MFLLIAVGLRGKFPAVFFAAAIVLVLGFMGCMVQPGSIASAFNTTFGTVFGTRFGAIFAAVCLAFFAFSAVLGRNLFGRINALCLFGRKFRRSCFAERNRTLRIHNLSRKI